MSGIIVKRFVETAMISALMNVMMEIWFLEMDVVNTAQLNEGTNVIRLEDLAHLVVRKLILLLQKEQTYLT